MTGIAQQCGNLQSELDFSCRYVSDNDAHEEQPPAAARARRFAAKSAPAGQRQIRTISLRTSRPDIEMITSLRQPPPAAPAKDGFGIRGQRGLWR
jgi:hypothetical protein